MCLQKMATMRLSGLMVLLQSNVLHRFVDVFVNLSPQETRLGVLCVDVVRAPPASSSK